MNLFLDTETFSPIDLFSRGLARYATQVEVMIETGDEERHVDVRGEHLLVDEVPR